MAADRASETNIVLPELCEYTLSQLNEVMPQHWSHHNPIDIIGDAPPERYHAALDICKNDDDIDAILTVLVPVSMVHPTAVAKQVIADEKDTEKPCRVKFYLIMRQCLHSVDTWSLIL